MAERWKVNVRLRVRVSVLLNFSTYADIGLWRRIGVALHVLSLGMKKCLGIFNQLCIKLRYVALLTIWRLQVWTPFYGSYSHLKPLFKNVSERSPRLLQLCIEYCFSFWFCFSFSFVFFVLHLCETILTICPFSHIHTHTLNHVTDWLIDWLIDISFIQITHNFIHQLNGRYKIYKHKYKQSA